jgi:hypothetical protein
VSATRRPGYVRLVRATAVVDGAGKRHCAQCGDYIDPIDWCPQGCRTGKPCGGGLHNAVRKRVDAAFCNGACRAEYRNSYIRDCVGPGRR